MSYEVKEIKDMAELRKLLRKRGTKPRAWVTYGASGQEVMVAVGKKELIERFKGVESDRKVKATYGTGGYVIIG